MRNEFKVEGMDGLVAKLLKMEDSLNNVDKVLEESAKPVKNAYKNNVKKSNSKHDHLQDNIVISSVQGIGTDKYVEVGVNEKSKVFWQGFLEFGTKNMPPQAPLTRAIESNRKNVLNSIKKGIQKLVSE